MGGSGFSPIDGFGLAEDRVDHSTWINFAAGNKSFCVYFNGSLSVEKLRSELSF